MKKFTDYFQEFMKNMKEPEKASYPKDKLKEGEQVEKEHVKNTKVGKKIAKRITQNHLDEDPGYYRKLKKVEKSDG